MAKTDLKIEVINSMKHSKVYLVGKICGALVNNGYNDLAYEMRKRVKDIEDYTNLMDILSEYVHIEFI